MTATGESKISGRAEPFDRICRATTQQGQALLAANDVEWTDGRRAIYRLWVLAQQTSRAALDLASQNLAVPALALTRARVEQLIVSSYLIYEEDQLGLGPYLKHMPVTTFVGVRAAINDPEIRAILAEDVDFVATKRAAVEAMSELAPGFDSASGKFRREWTTMNLRSMAHKRDVLEKATPSVSPYGMEQLYLTVYTTLSSVIHADSVAISPSILGTFDFRPRQAPQFSPNLIWIDSTFCNTAMLDLTQHFETMRFLGLDCFPQATLLLGEWRAAAAQLETM